MLPYDKLLSCNHPQVLWRPEAPWRGFRKSGKSGKSGYFFAEIVCFIRFWLVFGTEINEIHKKTNTF